VSREKPISVKVPKQKLLDSLNAALKSRKTELLDLEKQEKQREADEKEWEKNVIAHIVAGKAKVTAVSAQRRWHDDKTQKASVEVELPSSLVHPSEKKKNDKHTRVIWEINSEVEELENAVAILKLSEDEFVSTSTYKGVARYLR